MIFIEGSEHFVDVAGQNVNHVQIITITSLISSNNGNIMGTFQRMVMLSKGRS
jgi:hypothetical protein